MVTPGEEAFRGLMLANSIREFGGSLAGLAIWGLVPDGPVRLPLAAVARFEDAGVRLIPFQTDPALGSVPSSERVTALATAESLGGCELLVWIDPDSLVVGDPSGTIIDDPAALGYRPVHRRHIGSPWDEPLDRYWSLIFEACEVAAEDLYRMTTILGESIRPYIGTGVFTIRTDRRLGALWADTLARVSRHRDMADHYRRDRRYHVFLHRAVWTGVLLRHLERSEMHLLAPTVDYPLHLHHEIRAGRRALSLDSLTVVRTGAVLDDPEWRQAPLLEPLVPWLESQEFMLGR